MTRKNRVIFTDRKESDKGIMSVILGVISLISLMYGLIVSYYKEGNISERFGGALFVTLIFAFIGLGLGIASRMDSSKFKLCPTIGIILNGIVTCVLAYILWIGLR